MKRIQKANAFAIVEHAVQARLKRNAQKLARIDREIAKLAAEERGLLRAVQCLERHPLTRLRFVAK